MGKYEQKLNFKLFKDMKIISGVIDRPIEALELEFNFNVNCEFNRKIDVLAKDSVTNELIFIETQLTEADKKHYEEFTKLLTANHIDNCIFIWIAKSFSEDKLFELKSEILLYNKSIRIYFVTLSDRVIEALSNIEPYFDNVIDEIDSKIQVNIDDFIIVNSFENNNFTNSLLTISELFPKKHHNAKVLNEILERMRKLSDFMALHYYKDLSKHRMSFGIGADQFTASLGINNHRDTIYFSITFPLKLWHTLNCSGIRKTIDLELNCLVKYDEEKLRYFFEISNDKRNRQLMYDFFACSAVKLILIVYSSFKEKILCPERYTLTNKM